MDRRVYRRTRACLAVWFVAGGLLAAAAGAQSNAIVPPPDALQRAAAPFSAGDWTAALTAYESLAKSYPSFGLAHLRVGVSLMELGRFAPAEASMRRADSLGAAPPQAAFRLAQLLSERGKFDESIAQLRRAIGLGFISPPSALRADAHLKRLATHAQWPVVLDEMDAVLRPCMHDPRYREFDFWIGDWDVTPWGPPTAGAGTAPPARNTVTSLNNGCTVMEHWVAPNGYEGQSFNLFDKSLGQWRQTWVDNIGGQFDYRGALVQGNMVFAGDVPAPSGQPGRLPARLTFFAISRDTVRQLSQISSDSGRTWTTNYDLRYVRRRP